MTALGETACLPSPAQPHFYPNHVFIFTGQFDSTPRFQNWVFQICDTNLPSGCGIKADLPELRPRGPMPNPILPWGSLDLGPQSLLSYII